MKEYFSLSPEYDRDQLFLDGIISFSWEFYLRLPATARPMMYESDPLDCDQCSRTIAIPCDDTLCLVTFESAFLCDAHTRNRAHRRLCRTHEWDLKSRNSHKYRSIFSAWRKISRGKISLRKRRKSARRSPLSCRSGLYKGIIVFKNAVILYFPKKETKY